MAFKTPPSSEPMLAVKLRLPERLVRAAEAAASEASSEGNVITGEDVLAFNLESIFKKRSSKRQAEA